MAVFRERTLNNQWEKRMRRIKILIAAAAALVSTGAVAGLYQPAPFDVDLINQQAQGDMLFARNSESETAFIGCGVRAIEDGSGGLFKFGFCQAEDVEGDMIVCLTLNPALIDEMRQSNDSSFITFSWDTGPGPDENTCTRVGFSTQSFYLTEPENATKKQR